MFFVGVRRAGCSFAFVLERSSSSAPAVSEKEKAIHNKTNIDVISEPFTIFSFLYFHKHILLFEYHILVVVCYKRSLYFSVLKLIVISMRKVDKNLETFVK